MEVVNQCLKLRSYGTSSSPRPFMYILTITRTWPGTQVRGRQATGVQGTEELGQSSELQMKDQKENVIVGKGRKVRELTK